ncbi:MAG TPA: GH92 family glycosyl hydrolase [Acidobacteriaceae bacterium]|jgi:predicted alpha-1,2-mannosidase
MISRREFIQVSAGALASAAVPSHLLAYSGEAVDEDPLRWVDPRIGTGGHGHCFPGACVPFGAVQLSPDTYNDEWDWCSGYHISDSSIMGFSHTHLSGTGCGDLLDFLVMAGTGPVKLAPGSRANPDEGYRSRFSHEQEHMEPGYYSVFLQGPQVHVELTATERTGLHKYVFPQSDAAWLIVDLSHSYLKNGGSSVWSAELMNPAPDKLMGSRVTCAWAWRRPCSFAMQFSRVPDRIDFYSDDKLVTPAAFRDGKLEGDNLKAVLHFRTQANEAILVRTGISGVGAEGAARNLQAEQPDWDFARTRSAAQEKWREQIGRIHAEIADPDQKRTFYTSLYHMSIGPMLYDDVDGQYRGMDKRVHTLPPGQHNYTCFSLWDTFRAAHPAYTIWQTDRVPHFVNTLVRMAGESPEGVPVWPLQTVETGGMTGYHSASVMAEAIRKGIQGIDAKACYDALWRRCMVENFRGMGYYRQLGFIPADRESESVSECFEYCYDDWAVANIAHKIGRKDEAAMLVERSKNYRHSFNPTNQFMQAKLFDGSWATPFDPIELGHSSRWRDYTESNAWQTTFGVQHDPAGLIALFGGREQFLKRLDMLFSISSAQPPDAPLDIAGLVGQYAHGNEPSHHIAYLYAYAGAPHRTQERVRMLMDTMYRAEPDGIAGNEDVGQMSAWYVLSALGFYAVDPVGATYILGSPLIDRAKVNLGNGKYLTIEVKRSSPKHMYVHSFTLNGVPQQRAWFHHSDIAAGGHIVLEMGPDPNLAFGANADHLPPSLKLE